MPDEGERSEDRSPVAQSRLGRFLAARFAVSTAWQMQGVAIGWYVYALTDSAFDLGLIGLVQFLPFAALALPAGQFVDRHSNRVIAIAAYSIEGMCSIALAVMALTGGGSRGAIFAVIACYGVGRAFEQPAMQSWLPSLVPASAYPRAAAANSLAAQSAVIAGPAIGGLLYLAGPFVPFLVAAVVQCCGLAAVASLPGRRRGGREKLSWNGLLGGIRFIWGHEAVRGTISLDLLCVLFGGATALMPIFARDILAIGPVGLGLLRSAPALGALAMGIVLTRRPPQRRVGHRLLVAVAVYGVATLVFGLSRSVYVSVLALMILGAADMLSVVIRATLIQVIAPDAIRGRVTAVNGLSTGASNQLGQFESGVTAAWFGPVASVVLGGVATLVIAAFWARHFPALRRLDRLAMAERSVPA